MTGIIGFQLKWMLSLKSCSLKLEAGLSTGFVVVKIFEITP